MTIPTVSQQSTQLKNLSAATSWLLLGFLFAYLVISCSVKPYIPSLNYDDGWLAAINYLPFSPYVAGHDYVFTYGPLYFLNVCLDIEPNRLLTWLFYLFENLSIACVLFFYRRAFSLAKFSLLGAALLLSQLLNHNNFRGTWGTEYVRIIILVLLLSLPIISRTKALVLASAAAGFYAAVLMFIKFDLAIEVVITIFVFFILAQPFRIMYPVVHRFAFFSVWSLSLFLMAALTFREPANCFNWIWINIQHISLYTDLNDVPVPLPFFLPLGALSVLIYLFVALRNSANRDVSGYFALSLFPSIILMFKHGFVLANASHVNNFFRYILLAIACVIGFSRRTSDVFFLLIPFTFLVFVVPLLDYVHAVKWSQVSNPSRAASLRLNETFLPKDRQNKCFDAVPYDMSWCFANSVPYKPSPFILLYHAATSTRDRLVAQYFRGIKAPDYLFCEHSAWYPRNMFTETPLSWASILNFYQIKSYEPQKYLLLLEKKLQSCPPKFVPEKPFICNVNQWYAVPPCKHPLYCSFDLRPNLLGLICHWLYKLTSISINLKYADGHIQTIKLVPGVLKNGILINYLPEDMPALRLLFENKARQAVTQMELTGPGFTYYQTPIGALWSSQNDKVIEILTSKPEHCKLSTSARGNFSVPYVSVYSPCRDYIYGNTKETVPVFRKRIDELISVTLAVFQGESSNPPASLCVQIDNGPLMTTATGINLLAMSGQLTTREATTAGFMTAIQISNLNTGMHTISAVAQSRLDGKWYQIPNITKFSIK